MDERFYENDFMMGKSDDLEVIRSPFFDLAKKEKMSAQAASELVEEVALKLNYIEGLEIFLQPPIPTKENVAYTRYADETTDPAKRALFQFPRGQPHRIINKAELYRIQKTSVGEDRWAPIRRSKDFLSAKFFPPFDLKEGNLRKLLLDQASKDAYNKSTDSLEYVQWKSLLIELIPKLNHDVIVQLSLHLAYDAKVNDKEIWRAIEDASVASLHHMTLT